MPLLRPLLLKLRPVKERRGFIGSPQASSSPGTPRTPVLGTPKRLFAAVPLVYGSPLALLVASVQAPFIPVDFSKPTAVRLAPAPVVSSPLCLLQPPVAEPRTPVLGGPKQPLPAPPFQGGSPLTLLAPPVQNPFIPYDFSTTHDVISSPPQATPYNPNLFTNPIPF